MLNVDFMFKQAQRLRETEAHSEREQQQQPETSIEQNTNDVKFAEPKT